MTGLVQAEGCGIDVLSGWSVNGYLFDNAMDFQNGYYAALKQNFHYDAVPASSQCPPAAGYSVGDTSWSDSSYPSRFGQDLICGTFYVLGQPLPEYVLLIPSRDAYIAEVASSGSSFADLESWFEQYGGPGG